MVKLACGKGPKHRCDLLLVLLVWAALVSGCVQRSIERSTFRTVVIDPGHGGHDSGPNPRGVSPEKFWTLQVGLRL
jgi:N-acetylmuramoyl-L-alanine amidase